MRGGGGIENVRVKRGDHQGEKEKRKQLRVSSTNVPETKVLTHERQSFGPQLQLHRPQLECHTHAPGQSPQRSTLLPAHKPISFISVYISS